MHRTKQQRQTARFSLVVLACGVASASLLAGCPPANKDTAPAAPAPAAAPKPAPTKTSTAPHEAHPTAPASQPHSQWKDGRTIRGLPLTNAAETALADVLKNSAAYASKKVKTSGTVARACAKMGCWIELRPDGSEDAIRVTFKDYGFTVPLDSQGAKAVVEGSIETKTLKKEDADHLEGEGAKIKRQANGEAIEIAMVADGIELVKTVTQ